MAMKTRRSFLWVCVVVLALLIIYPIVAKNAHWPGWQLGFVLWPVTLSLLLVVINRLATFEYFVVKERDVDCTLKVDYRVRYSLISTMKMKRRTAWLYLITSVMVALESMVGLAVEGSPAWALLLVLSVALGWIGFDKSKVSKAVEKSIKTNNQAAFNDAILKLRKHYKHSIVVYILIVLIPLLMVLWTNLAG